MSYDRHAWRRFDAEAWAREQTTIGRPAVKARRRPPLASRLTHAAVTWLLVALGAASIAVAQTAGDGGEPSAGAAQNGEPIQLGERNPASGAGATQETAIVANIGNNGQSTRQSNNAKGGRAAGYGCDNDGTQEIHACANYVNRGQGPAAAFRTRGKVPFVIRDTNDGLVQFLNVDRLDNMHASEIVTAARKKDGLDADTLDGIDSSALASRLFAAVDADSTGASVLRGAGATGAARDAVGEFDVTFDRDVSDCVYVATLSDNADQDPPAGEIAASLESATAVEVRTYNSAGVLTDPADDDGFQLAVHC